MPATYPNFEAWLASDEPGARLTRMLVAGNDDARNAAAVAFTSGQVNASLLHTEAMQRAFDEASSKVFVATPATGVPQ